MICAGRRSGKTELGKRRLVTALAEPKDWPDPRYFFAAPTYMQAKKIAWDDFKAMVPREWVKSISESELSIRTVMGSELWIVGLDKPQRVEGVPYDGGFADESCDLRPLAWEQVVYPSLMDRRGWAWRSAVPKRFGLSAPEFRESFERAARGELPDTEAFHWVSGDILPPDVVEHARKVLDPITFAEQLEASWQSPAGRIYYNFEREYAIRPCRYDPSRPVIVTCDFNVDYMCWELCHERNDEIEVFDELYRQGQSTQQTLDVLHQRYGNHRGFRFYGDAAGRQRATSAAMSDYQTILADKRFVDLGRTVHFSGGNPPVADRYAAVCALLHTKRLWVDPLCRRLIADFETVAYMPGTRTAQKGGELTHASDALGYFIFYEHPVVGVFDQVGGAFSV